jgi:hypothetical protein
VLNLLGVKNLLVKAFWLLRRSLHFVILGRALCAEGPMHYASCEAILMRAKRMPCGQRNDDTQLTDQSQENMAFVPIKASEYVKKHIKINPRDNAAEFDK